jgi:mannose-6-phosphate isomerase
MFSLYPMKFKPVLKEKIWGGQRIKTQYSVYDNDIASCGEAWLISGITDSETEVMNGYFEGNTVREMAEIFMDDFLGEKIYEKHGDEFPLLFKIIDANDYLSVQVHPDDEIAKTKHGLKSGKSEMWYIIDAVPGAQIVAGFNKPMTKELLLKHLESGTLQSILNFEPVQKGDFIYIPAGLVHAMCPGILVAEIQQSSDTTYRLYDWGRTDEKGQSRTLHISEAADAIRYDLKSSVIRHFQPPVNQSTPMLETTHFSAQFVNLHSTLIKNFQGQDSFIVYFTLSGNYDLICRNQTVNVKSGECILIPAMVEELVFRPNQSAQLIEIIPA